MRKDIPKNRTALLAGATGLVGSSLLNLLLKDEVYAKVKIIVRNDTGIINKKLEQLIVDFNNLQNYVEFLTADDIFCCLGTTIKNAGSQQAFRKVDFDYPLHLAKLSLKNGAKQYLIVTSLSADSVSKIFYNRVKGEIEDEIMKLPFKSINIFRPSLLLGSRKEVRLKEKTGEYFLKIFSFILVKKLRKYRAIEASAVAGAMLITAKEFHPGIDVFESDRIQAISDI